ncbi:serine hydrolase domain-containing protein [Halioxenophilus sp. WMMB6]|uniref:serine hydrolase domain-containing protein n=1 Tax=Halioxenophilus sp. WMMB6 TaxID=3073815 RepID=UPI00295EE67F|nr:serine hydrolase domain-containing protein [Halioxenophilus sp. WMMB6]
MSATAEQDYEALYQQRLATVMANGGFMRAYEPQEPVLGATDYQPLVSVAAEERTLSAASLAEAIDYAERNNSDAFMVWQGGRLQAASYFGEVSQTTPLVSKSLSKPLGAIAVGRALQLGAIQSLDQAVADFITEWRGTPKALVKVRHLLDMRSGFLAQGFSTDPDHPWNRAYLSLEHGDYLIHHYPLAAEPGEKYLYNNATGDMVALLIERATGQRYGDFIGQEVLAKVGAAGGSIWVDRPQGLAHSGCCMYLPAESWLRLALLLLNNGMVEGERLLPEGYVQAMATATEQNPHYGLGVWVAGDYVERRGFTGPGGPGPQVLHSQPYADETLFMFDGNSNQVVYVLPKYDMVVLRLGRTPPKSPEWDNSLLPNLLVKGLLAKP